MVLVLTVSTAEKGLLLVGIAEVGLSYKYIKSG